MCVSREVSVFLLFFCVKLLLNVFAFFLIRIVKVAPAKKKKKKWLTLEQSLSKKHQLKTENTQCQSLKQTLLWY